MADKPLPWFRFYYEAASDPKFDVISMTTGIEWCAVFGAWSKILCIAAASPIRGSLYVTLQKRYSNDNVTSLLRFTNKQTEAIMQSFIDCDMVDLDENGAYRVKNWGKRQYDSDNSAKRVKKFRDKKNETFQKRYSNDNVTPPDTDTEPEEEEAPTATTAPTPSPVRTVPNEQALSMDTIAIKIYSGVTGFSVMNEAAAKSIDIIYSIYMDQGCKKIETTIQYMKPYYESYINHTNGNGKKYSRLGVGWVDWALEGDLHNQPAKTNGRRNRTWADLEGD